ncbi:histidinol-phosphate aminotransferase [Peptoclostridium litorale DSM 5388]|uniref:Histidinol-phosphate aminotransferase n=1 Tax=Peptoclostridium litorale DSM 5388 TaxID=1121324 RepID=A0A069RED8_PEPLI|nr:histidinol-phosphate transaminase [Peptoclostridium litorale]KDR95439.1 histidinol-phosphate aminotransferase HisC [Peptoclostridium litorale DSM 5388]SIO18725.1 histidinol-phosphate aminotransferase [Peptoclostridium litorale DSM 5388]
MEKNLFRKEIAEMRAYIPGKPIEDVKRELGIDDIVKLASNENPLGPSPKAVEAIREMAYNINIYPDGAARSLREDIAGMYEVDADQIFVGNGGEEILKLITGLFINPGDEAIMADPTFSLYESGVVHMGGTAVKLPLKDHKHDFEGFVSRVNDRTKLIFVCNPNNPTGNIMTSDEIEYLAKSIPEHVVLVLDEAYYEYAKRNRNYPESIDILRKRPNTIILRTFSKVAGLAGVRMGYALTSKDIAAEVGKIRGVFSVNLLAQAAGRAAIKDQEHIEKTVDLNYESMDMMERFFEDNNMEYIKSNANFVFANVGMDSKDVFQKLQQRGIIIRPGFLWNMDTWLRVSTGTLEQTQIFVSAMEDILKEK